MVTHPNLSNGAGSFCSGYFVVYLTSWGCCGFPVTLPGFRGEEENQMDVPFPQGSLRSPWATARRPPGSNLAGVDPPEHSADEWGDEYARPGWPPNGW